MDKRTNKTNNDSLVSAIITTHNRLHLLKRAVQSVQNQSYANIELIVVDDSSDDGTGEWCKRQDFKYIYNNLKNKGGNYVRNIGIKAANGKYIAFLDDDDYWLAEKITKQVELIEQRSCDIVFCGRFNEIVMTNGDTKLIPSLPSKLFQGNISSLILSSIVTTTSAILVKKKTLFRVGLFDENLRFWQEYDLSIRIAQKSEFYFVPEPLIKYRIDKNDKNRLTNKYEEWKISVKYIENKYKFLYNSTLLKTLDHKLLVWHEITQRASLQKNPFDYILAKLLIFICLPYRIIRKLVREIKLKSIYYI